MKKYNLLALFLLSGIFCYADKRRLEESVRLSVLAEVDRPELPSEKRIRSLSFEKKDETCPVSPPVKNKRTYKNSLTVEESSCPATSPEPKQQAPSFPIKKAAPLAVALVKSDLQASQKDTPCPTSPQIK